MVRRRNNRSRRSNAQPIAVYSAPVSLRPSFVTAVNVNIVATSSATGTIVVPASLASIPYRITSFQGTLLPDTTTTITGVVISLVNAATDLASVQSRPMALPSGQSLEIKLKQDKRVLHSLPVTGSTRPGLTIAVTSGTARLTGVLRISSLGVM